jgi:hypothetical protein
MKHTLTAHKHTRRSVCVCAYVCVIAQKASNSRARRFIGWLSWPESRVQVRQRTKQGVVQRFGLTSEHGRSKAACTCPLHQSQQSCIFYARGRALQGTQSATKLKGTPRRVGRALARNFAPFRARSSDRGRPKGSKKRARRASMPNFCLATQFYSGGAERAERHD